MAKVINLFDQSKVVENTGVKYSDLLMKLMAPFEKELEKMGNLEDVIDFSTDVWNFANHQMLFSGEVNKKQFDQIIKEQFSGISGLAKKMIDYKMKNFKDYTNFISEFEIDRSGKEPKLSIISQDKETYLANIVQQIEKEGMDESYDYEEGFIDRSAIIITPLKAFFDWLEDTYPGDDPQDFKEPKVYLVNDEITDLEAWLKKNYDQLFSQELFNQNTDESKWPKKRSYKMFRQWFEVSISPFVFDMESQPVFKA